MQTTACSAPSLAAFEAHLVEDVLDVPLSDVEGEATDIAARHLSGGLGASLREKGSRPGCVAYRSLQVGISDQPCRSSGSLWSSWSRLSRSAVPPQQHSSSSSKQQLPPPTQLRESCSLLPPRSRPAPSSHELELLHAASPQQQHQSPPAGRSSKSSRPLLGRGGRGLV